MTQGKNTSVLKRPVTGGTKKMYKIRCGKRFACASSMLLCMGTVAAYTAAGSILRRPAAHTLHCRKSLHQITRPAVALTHLSETPKLPAQNRTAATALANFISCDTVLEKKPSVPSVSRIQTRGVTSLVQPVTPARIVKPANTAEVVKHTKVAKIVEPAKTVKPVKSNKAVKAVEPVKPVQSVLQTTLPKAPKKSNTVDKLPSTPKHSAVDRCRTAGKTASVYVLQLAGGFIYVGKSVDVPRRLQQHMKGIGAAFTKVYKPTGKLLPLLGTLKGDGDGPERDETLRQMYKHGFRNVRGWKFCNRYHTAADIHEIESNIRELMDLCRRCGGHGHFASTCRARVDRLGRPLVSR